MSEISIGDLYTFNKQLMENMPAQNENETNQIVRNYFLAREHNYYMLLCHEARDYTVFHLESRFSAEKATNELETCMKNRGIVQSVEETEDKQALEIWIKNNNESFCYYLFPYDEGVIDCGL